MIQDGTTQFVEYGPGKVLGGLIRKIDSEVEAVSTDNRED
jgi:malonyl CoA-acyl carrier protein transacylase